LKPHLQEREELREVEEVLGDPQNDEVDVEAGLGNNARRKGLEEVVRTELRRAENLKERARQDQSEEGDQLVTGEPLERVPLHLRLRSELDDVLRCRHERNVLKRGGEEE